MNALHRIVYFSSATRDTSQADIEKILGISRRRNTQDGITGLMLYHDGSFLQILEGPRARLEACYTRIANDPRHHQLSRVSSQDTSSRVFDEWAMASLPFLSATAEAQEGFLNIRRLQEGQTRMAAEADPATRAFLKAFLKSLR